MGEGPACRTSNGATIGFPVGLSYVFISDEKNVDKKM